MSKFAIFILKIIFYVTILVGLISQANAYENKIQFKVDNEIITSIDILHEIEFRKLLNLRLNELPKQKLFEIATKSLIREKIRKIEISKFFIETEIDDENLELLLNDFIKKSSLKSKFQLQKFLNSKNIKIETFIEKIKIEILWNQMIVSKFSQNIKVDKTKIKKDILKNNKQKNYLLSEIVFNLEKQTLLQKYSKIKKEIYENGFENAASTFSISDSAKAGGKLGWVKFNSLSKSIKKEILATSKNDFTKPITIPGGFLILKIEDEREINIIENIDLEVENIARSMANKQLNQFSNIYFNKIKKKFNIYEL